MEIWSVAVILATVVVALEVVSVLRRGAGAQRGYLALLLVDGALLGGTLADPRFAGDGSRPTPTLVAGVLLCVLVVFVPLLLDRLARRALGREQVGLAARLAGVKELLQPGKAATAERELYTELAFVRAGRVDEVVHRLRARLSDVESPEEEALLHDRIITAFGFGERWREAATHFESHVGPAQVLRSPALAVQMVRAYGELGELARAGVIVHRIEHAAQAQDPRALIVLREVRLVFLAFVGGPRLIGPLVSPRELARIPERLRGLLETAHSPSEGPPPEVERFAAQVAGRAAADVRSDRAVSSPRTPVTYGLILVNVTAFALFLVLGGAFDSGSDLVRAGASLHAGVRAGEWWRLWTAMFLHGGGNVRQGLLHLGLNMYGLYLLGRIVEPLFGRPRFFIIYALGGLVGNLLSVYNPYPAAVLSLGASGAVLGLMGALLMTLIFRPRGWPAAARRTLIVNLTVLLLAQLGIGVLVRVVDNFAHVGGLVGGALAAIVLLPGGLLGSGRAAKVAVGVVLCALTGSAAAATASLARERVAATLAKLPRRSEKLGGITLSVAAYAHRQTVEEPDWPGEEAVEDPVAGLGFAPHVVPMDSRGSSSLLRDCAARDLAALGKRARELNQPDPVLEDAPPVEVAGWTALGQLERRSPARLLLYYARPVDGERAEVIEVNYEGRWPMEGGARAELERVIGSAALK